ncbi:MAG: hypothetical protein LUQ65_00530 [Candidatus Helarchaeota archaeon]|nr:hypothetical protein [Candidatus Helarchaeota archaeon]
MKSKSKIFGVIILQIVILMGILTNCSVLANNTPWYRTWGGTEDEFANAIAIAADGSIYCVGNSASFGGSDTDFFLVKYHSNGTKLWDKVWGNASYEELKGVAVDENGSVYCVGRIQLMPAILMLFKFFPNGTQWWNLSRIAPNLMDSWQDVLVDENGSIYCTGLTSEFGAVNGDLVVIKYHANRTFAWAAHRDSGAGGDDCGFDLTMDSEGAIYCIGHTFSSGYRFFLVKFFADGSYYWSKTWGSGTANHGYGIGLGLDGCIYCAGETNPLTYRDLVLTKFYPGGTEVWTITWGESATHESALGLAIDSSGNILCAGYQGTDIILRKYGANGTLLLSTSWGGGDSDFAEDVAIDSLGSIYCVGETMSWGAGKKDLLLVKFSASGDGPSTGGGIPGFALLFTVISISAVVLYLKKRKI